MLYGKMFIRNGKSRNYERKTFITDSDATSNM